MSSNQSRRGVRTRIFGPLERRVRRSLIRQLTNLPLRGVTTGETLLEVDEEIGPSHRLWIASDDAIYVTDPPFERRVEYHVRVPYGDIRSYEEHQRGRVLTRRLVIADDAATEVAGDFERPRRDLTSVIRRRSSAAATPMRSTDPDASH
jgi:hypothetical protein